MSLNLLKSDCFFNHGWTPIDTRGCDVPANPLRNKNQLKFMTINDVIAIGDRLIVSLGGGALIVFAFSSWLGKVWAKRILEKDKRKYKSELEKILRYSENQFSRYNDLWIQLCDLRLAGENLWNEATKTTLSVFVKQLTKTENKVDQSFLFVEEAHYRALKNLFEAFRQFQFGKSRLMDIRSQRDQNNYDFSENQITETINKNGETRERYLNPF